VTNEVYVKRIILSAPLCTFLTGISFGYALFGPSPGALIGLVGLIPLGIGVGLIASGLRASEEDT
jgi:hypothetical protein